MVLLCVMYFLYPPSFAGEHCLMAIGVVKKVLTLLTH